MGKGYQNIVYCSSTRQAIGFTLEYARREEEKDNEELFILSRDIKNEVHGDYYLADIILRGVAYHIGYLPSAIRMRIEDLFRRGLIKTMFCTSTLVEGVNLPADNLFITNYKSGRTKMTPVDFKNLIGRVGRIEYNLYGNVYLVRLADTVKIKDFVDLITKEIPEQKLSITSGLTKPQKKKIVECLLEGNIELIKYPKNQTAESYSLMRKFANILLRDIIEDKESLWIGNPFDKITPNKKLL
jgi:replicative superfamily II helicase